ncbi:hypothetical protein [Methanimicrococcus hongohii]|uniref:hypothetical protein n=1 Tax=Methanimicrococcus hongohii TaxID=3028295 RepID=UPI0029301652|nr:hypothetical protein [Methanimicrococcus sp. Hf6]
MLRNFSGFAGLQFRAGSVCSGREVFVCSWREVFVCSGRKVFVCSGREVFIEKSLRDFSTALLRRFSQLPVAARRASRTNFNKPRKNKYSFF